MKLTNRFGIKVLFASAFAFAVLAQLQDAQAGDFSGVYYYWRYLLGFGF